MPGDYMFKKLLSSTLIALFILLFSELSIPANSSLGISAKAAVVIECNSGKVIYANNENERMSMASTTKIMTSLLALENCELDEEFTVFGEMLKVEGTSMGLVDGDIVTMR